MFDGVTAPLLVPILQPDYVADQIVQAILKNKPLLRMPWMVKFVPFFQAVLPRKVFEVVCGRGMGIYAAMDHFRGH
jgi:short-subunit dehydrogenase